MLIPRCLLAQICWADEVDRDFERWLPAQRPWLSCRSPRWLWKPCVQDATLFHTPPRDVREGHF